jgi:translation initiation factor IF-3
LAKFVPNRNEQREPEFRINDRIRVPEVRLVGDNLPELSELVGETINNSEVYPTRVARQWAEKAELDLVEISSNSSPPVCRIIDFNKFLYDRKKKDKELKAKQVKTVIKEIRFGPNTDDHDFDFKLKHAIRFLEEGSKVKAYVQFKGRAIVFKDRGEELLKRFLEGLEEHGQPEADLKLEGRRMFVHIVPKKKKK